MNEPNWELLLKAAIYGKQEAYNEYKQAAKDALEYTFVNKDGEICLKEGQAERNQKAMDLWKEVMRLDYEIKRIRNSIKLEDIKEEIERVKRGK